MMHEGEVATDAHQVARLVASQFPSWVGRSVTPLPLGGTDHSLYRLGDDLLVRLPRIGWAVDQVESDRRWLPVLAPRLPLPVPVPVAVGEPGDGFPWRWSVVPWVAGENPTADTVDLVATARQLGEFVLALRGIDTAGGPAATGLARGVPLAARDAVTREAIDELGGRVDGARVTAAWEEALTAGVWTDPPAWVHGDLQAGNLIARDRRLTAVIDFGGLGLGDPAVDLMPAWSLLDRRSRAEFRERAGCDEDTWRRGKGWALSTAVIALPYYWDTVPGIVAASQRTIAEVLAET